MVIGITFDTIICVCVFISSKQHTFDSCPSAELSEQSSMNVFNFEKKKTILSIDFNYYQSKHHLTEFHYRVSLISVKIMTIFVWNHFFNEFSVFGEGKRTIELFSHFQAGSQLCPHFFFRSNFSIFREHLLFCFECHLFLPKKPSQTDSRTYFPTPFFASWIFPSVKMNRQKIEMWKL